MLLTIMSAESLSKLRKRRAVVRRSITCLSNGLRDLEATPDRDGVMDRAQQSIIKIGSLEKEFKTIHLEIVDLIDDGDTAVHEKEQETLDKLDEDVASITIRLQQLVAKCGSSATSGALKSSSRKLSRLERSLIAVNEALALIPVDHDDVPLLEQYSERLLDYKRDLATIYDDLATHDLNDDDALLVLHAKLERLQFECSHRVKTLLRTHSSRSTSRSTSASTADNKGVRLPKLDVPTFNGDVQHWTTFWEQFAISVHDRTSLSNAEKLVYLQQAIKSGSAKSAIEGLSRSGDNYDEAIACLKSRYNRPRLIHRAHVQRIMDAQPLKDGSGKELRRLHETLQQHLRALKAMKCEPDSSFVTSVIELKLDSETMFEWQKHSQDKTEVVPHYQDILDFIDLRAQASETIPPKKQVKTDPPYMRKPVHGKHITSLAANAGSDSYRTQCVLCTSEQHPLYICPKFKSLSHEDKHAVLKRNNLCVNCLGRHFIKQCRSLQRCKHCQRSHHTLLHIEPPTNTIPTTAGSNAAPGNGTPEVPSHAAIKLKSSSLLMTCRVIVTSPQGHSVEARALLDSASSASFVSERLVQSLHLPRAHQSIRVTGIAGSFPKSPIQSIATFQVSATHCQGRKFNLTAIVVPKVTCDLPITPIPFDLTWKSHFRHTSCRSHFWATWTYRHFARGRYLY